MAKDNKLKITSEIIPNATIDLAEKFQFNGNNGFNLVPRAVIVIAGTPCIPLSLDFNLNDERESNTVTATFQSDLLDISAMYEEVNLDENAFVCEVWVGYLDSRYQTAWTQDYENYKEFLSNDELKNDLLENYRTKLFRNYIGVIKQFEFSLDPEGDTTSLIIGDFSLFLQEHDFEVSLKDDETKLENVVKLLNENLKTFEIVYDKEVIEEKNILLGKETKIKKDKDSGEETEEEKEVKYNTEGKTYFDILNDILEKANLSYEVDLTNFDILDNKKDKIRYILKRRYTSDITWILQREKHFNKCSIRSGKIGVGHNSKIMVEMRSLNEDTNEYVSGTFPENLSTSSNPVGTRYYVYNVSNNKEKKELDLLAKEKAKSFSKYDLNGEIMLPNALIGIMPEHNLIILDNVSNKNLSLNRLSGDINVYDDKTQDCINFNINNISMSYTFGEGFNQRIDFNLNYNLNLIDPKTGKLQGRNLFPKAKYEYKDKNFSISFFDPFRPTIESLPSPLRKIREQGGI